MSDEISGQIRKLQQETSAELSKYQQEYTAVSGMSVIMDGHQEAIRAFDDEKHTCDDFGLRISSYLHGKKRKRILDWDAGYYFVGRGECEYDKDNRVYSGITLKFDCELYKYEFTASDEDWIGDTSDLEDGILRVREHAEIKEGDNEMIFTGNYSVLPERREYGRIILDGGLPQDISGLNYTGVDIQRFRVGRDTKAVSRQHGLEKELLLAQPAFTSSMVTSQCQWYERA